MVDPDKFMRTYVGLLPCIM